MQSLYSQLRHGYHITTHIIYAESIFTIKTWIPHNYPYNLCRDLYSQLRHGYHITTHIIYAESIFTIKTWIPHNYPYNLCRVYIHN